MRSSSRVTLATWSKRAAIPIVRTSSAPIRNHGQTTRSGGGVAGRARSRTALSARLTPAELVPIVQHERLRLTQDVAVGKRAGPAATENGLGFLIMLDRQVE